MNAEEFDFIRCEILRKMENQWPIRIGSKQGKLQMVAFNLRVEDDNGQFLVSFTVAPLPDSS